MAEAPNGRLTVERPASSTAPSIAAVKAAIGETRHRLAAQVARTADQVHLIFTTPNSFGTEARVRGAVAGAMRLIATAGHATRVWSDVRQTGLLRRAAIGGVIMAVAAALATKTRRR